MPKTATESITLKVLLEIAANEAIVREAYRDSVGIWTWGIGVTNSSGHIVYPRYKDNPQTRKKCLELFEWLLRTRYAPAVLSVFRKADLAEHEFAAALSFHYNTGAIETARWPKLWMDGDVKGARRAIMNWKTPAEIIPRRERERDLFFEGKWNTSPYVAEYQVSKPSYRPDWSSKKMVRVDAILADIVAERNNPVDDDPGGGILTVPQSVRDSIDSLIEELKALTGAKDISLIYD